MQRVKASVDRRIEAAQEERGILIVFTGAGKGKTTAALGMVMCCIGHGMKVAIVQFIKGELNFSLSGPGGGSEDRAVLHADQ